MHHARFRDPAGAVQRDNWTESGVEFAGREYDRIEDVGRLEHAVAIPGE